MPLGGRFCVSASTPVRGLGTVPDDLGTINLNDRSGGGEGAQPPGSMAKVWLPVIVPTKVSVAVTVAEGGAPHGDGTETPALKV